MESSVIPLEKTDSSIDASQVLAVIPALNEARHIETCIRSLMTGDIWLRSVSLVVVDGGSTDGTADIVEGLIKEFPNLSIIYNP